PEMEYHWLVKLELQTIEFTPG
ncbi:MAG: hypothetical protein RL566_786, partial [Actinomycetota bacterium]